MARVLRFEVICDKFNLVKISTVWTLEQCKKNMLRTTKIKYLRRTARYTLLDRKRNEDI
jgi:hypothetical protein